MTQEGQDAERSGGRSASGGGKPGSKASRRLNEAAALRIRRWLLLVGIAFGAALLTGWTQQLWLDSLQERERQRAELYWNGYAQLYAEMTGGWEGLQERLDAGGYMYANESAFSFKVYEPSGEGEVVAELTHGEGAANGRMLPVMAQGEIIGYTEVVVAPMKFPPMLNYGTPAIAAALLLTAGFLLLGRLERADVRARQRAAADLLAYMNRIRSRLSSGSNRDPSGTSENRQKGAAAFGLPLDLGRTPVAFAADKEDVAPHSGAPSTWENLQRQVAELITHNDRLETVRSTMVADIAHELRTPIAIMRAALDRTLQSGEPLAPDKAALLHDETLRLTRLVRELQELALAESGHLPLTKVWFPLGELAEEVLETLAAEGEERGIGYVVSGRREARIYGDKGRIRQMLINLAGNAFRHARSMVQIDIALHESDIELTVSDDGQGIEEEELGRVFDRFYKGSAARANSRDRNGGLGLGLAIVREFARAHGGDAKVQSRYGEGTRFIVTLPVMKE